MLVNRLCKWYVQTSIEDLLKIVEEALIEIINCGIKKSNFSLAIRPYSNGPAIL
jgi:hypothetical protein